MSDFIAFNKNNDFIVLNVNTLKKEIESITHLSNIWLILWTAVFDRFSDVSVLPTLLRGLGKGIHLYDSCGTITM